MVEILHATRRQSGRPSRQRLFNLELETRFCLFGLVAKSFHLWPAIIGAFVDKVDLVVGSCTVFRGVKQTLRRKHEALWIAVSKAVHVVVKRIVGHRLSIPIHAKHLPSQRRKVLGDVLDKRLPRGHVQVAVGAFDQAAAVVGRVARKLSNQNGRVHHRPGVHRVCQTREPTTVQFIRVVHVDVGRQRKVGMKHHGMGSAVVPRLVHVWDVVDGFSLLCVRVDAGQSARFFKTPDVVVRPPHQIPRNRQIFGHRIHLQVCRLLRIRHAPCKQPQNHDQPPLHFHGAKVEWRTNTHQTRKWVTVSPQHHMPSNAQSGPPCKCWHILILQCIQSEGACRKLGCR